MTTLIDLTMEIREEMPRNLAHGRYPLFMSGTQTHAELAKRGVTNVYDSGDIVTTHNDVVALSTHSGTHMDAPFHADANSEETIEKMPLSAGFGSAVCLDVSAAFGPRVAVTASQLEAADRANESPVTEGDIVLVHTGMDAMHSDPSAWYEEHMGLSRDAGEWLRARRVRTVGIDSCSVDPAGASELPVHMNFLRPRSIGLSPHDWIAVIESLTNLSELPRRRFTFVGVPLPLAGATGSPIRAMAIVD